MAENKSVDMGQSNTGSKKTILSEKNKKLIFYTLMIAPLVLQVLVFYVYVNLSTFSLAFTEYSVVEGVGKGYVSKFVGFDNFVFMINDIFSPQNVGMIGVSFLMYAFV
jgi:ABC-type sugar transport system permease subunit